ncbi:MAG: galactose-1-phosphate uridylyltransferase [Nitrospirota bacterium]|jgi:UDPglucose--hexose-1-phosphate uridylyltransferase
MPELRLNLITREWVIIQCERARKPEEFAQRRERKYQPERLDSCPFCPGNEQKTPGEFARIPSDGSWRIRVIPNKYAALLDEGELLRTNEGHRHLVAGVGRHEVIVESPVHNMSTALFEIEQLTDILKMYKSRLVEAYKDGRVEHVIIFKNHGPSSGTSILHPHSQLIGIPITPIGIRNRMDEAMRYFDNTGECLLCAILKEDLAEGRRVVHETERFAAVIPYAALSPFHTWIVPKWHTASLADCSDDDMKELAGVLKATMHKFYHALDDPDYNYMIFTRGPFRYRSEYVHWYISIIPRVAPAAGFELGSGIYINHAIPEDVAEYLRSVKVS